VSDPYWRTQAGINKEQRERIEALEYSLESQAQRLRSQFAKAQGGLENRLSALARAFDAFVELSDLRTELTLYGDAAVARHRVRKFLAEVMAGRAAPLALDDVPGYWLVPAARALAAQLAGDRTGSAGHVTTATEWDATRTTLFLTAAATQMGLPGVTAVQLAALLPAAGTPGTPVTHAQRAIWLAAADGRFGAAGRALLTERLTTLLSTPDAGTERDQWREAVQRLDRTARSAPLPPQRRAAAALAALRAHCAAPPAPTPAQSDVDGTADADPLGDIVRRLVDEGSAAEVPLLRRAEELRRIVTSDTAHPASHQPWDAVVGSVHELVRADFAPDAPPALRGVALRAARRWLAAVADDLAAEAAADPPRTLTTRSTGYTVTVDVNGAVPGEYAAAERHIDTSFQSPRGPRVAAAGTGIAAAALAVVGFLADLPWLAVFALLAAAVAALRFRKQTRLAAEYAEAATAAKTSLRQDVEKVRNRLAADRDAVLAGRRQARDDQEELSTLLS
jgi:hypothetical protein